MGREKEPAAGGLRWPRAVAHLAIVVVFVLVALGYAPFVEHATKATKVASGTDRTMASADRACDAHRPAETPAGIVRSQDARTSDAAPSGARKCARPEAQAAH